MNSLFLLLVKLLFGKEVGVMAVIYATLILKGVKKIEDVPAVIRPKVETILEALEI